MIAQAVTWVETLLEAPGQPRISALGAMFHSPCSLRRAISQKEAW